MRKYNGSTRPRSLNENPHFYLHKEDNVDLVLSGKLYSWRYPSNPSASLTYKTFLQRWIQLLSCSQANKDIHACTWRTEVGKHEKVSEVEGNYKENLTEEWLRLWRVAFSMHESVPSRVRMIIG